MADKFIPRIVYEDSVSVYADGSMKTIWEDTQSSDRFDYIPQKPLLVINPSEITKEGIRKIIKEGHYKKLFCDINRVRELELICKRNSLNFQDYFKTMFCCSDDLFKEFTSAKTQEERQAILEKHYDERLASITPENIPHLIKETYGDIIFNKLTEVSNDRQEKEIWFREEYASIPSYLRNILEKIGVQFVVTESDKNASNLGRSDYTNGSIYVQTQSIRTLSEEMVHQADSFLRFSEKYNWKRAVNKDVAPDNKTLAQFYTQQNKASLFDGDSYSPEDRFAEVLADMFNMLRIGKEHFPDIEKDFSHTMPLFMQFITEARKISEEFKEEKLTREALANPERHQFSKRVRAEREGGGSGLSRGSERTEPKPRTSWVKTVTP